MDQGKDNEGQVMLDPSAVKEGNAIEPVWELEDQICLGIQEDLSLEAVLVFLSNNPEKAPRTVQEKFKHYTWVDGLLFFDR